MPIELPSIGRPQLTSQSLDGIYPVWFNSIVKPDTLTLRCKIVVTKLSTGQTIVSIDHQGVARNQRARPDCCPSYRHVHNTCTPCSGLCVQISPVPKMPEGPFPYGNSMSGNLAGLCNGVPSTFTSYTSNSQTDDWCNYLGRGTGQYNWICAEYRYTTPQFTVTSQDVDRDISLHALVPHTSNGYFGSVIEHLSGYCTTAKQFAYGMDISAADEIVALEAAGFTWSTLPESDKVWVAKTNFGELRILHTLNDSDLAAGHVIRTFRDWNGSGNFHRTVQRNGFQIEILTSLTESESCSQPSQDCPDCRFSFPERLPERLKLEINLAAGSSTITPDGRCYDMGGLRVFVMPGQHQYLKCDAEPTKSSDCCGGDPIQPATECGVQIVRYRNVYACPQQEDGSFHKADTKMTYATSAGASAQCAALCGLEGGCYPNQEPYDPYNGDGGLDTPMYIDCDAIKFDAFAVQYLNPQAPNNCSFPCTDGGAMAFDRYFVAWRASKAARGLDTTDPRGEYGYPYIYGKDSQAQNADWTVLPESWASTVTITGA